MSAAVAAGATYLGFVFFPKSPRNVGFETAARLAQAVPPGVAKVALTVNADDALLDQITNAVPIDVLQLQGAEAPERVAEVKARYGLPVMKAIGIEDASDVSALDAYEGAADILLVDAKPPKGSTRSGGNGVAFDWRLLDGRDWQTPWMLAGGLTADNVAEAIRLTGAPVVDVSSGVESSPGIKDEHKIAAFIRAAQGG